jgi:hypothetical protein
MLSTPDKNVLLKFKIFGYRFSFVMFQNHHVLWLPIGRERDHLIFKIAKWSIGRYHICIAYKTTLFACIVKKL